MQPSKDCKNITPNGLLKIRIMCYNLAYMEKKQLKYAERYKEVLADNAIRQAFQDELDT